MKTCKRSLTAFHKKTSGNYASAEERWSALLHREAKADGQFYYSVKTTGVYCRPSCTARLALRENVLFHDSREAAERAGYRACKRCQPNGRAVIEEYAVKIATACRSIQMAEEMPGLDVLAKTAVMSKFHFHRVFTKIVGLTPKAYAKAHRAGQMRKELSESHTVTEAIYRAGFQSNARFYAESWGMLGMMPKKFRAKGKGEIIRFAVGESSLGSLLVATSEKGICAMMLGDDPNQLARELQDQFSQAEFVGGDQEFEHLVARVVGFIETPKLGLDLPLDIRGTAFQQRVWLALGKIPLGETVSYSDVARSIGAPKSVRAVASACAANRIALAIPCHRVVRADGHASGYRWGVERKLSLLQREKTVEVP